MFVCTECKAKYQDKPEYCDCGNNIFEEIFIGDVDSSNDENLPFIKPKASNRSFFERNPSLERLAKSFDILSVSIFSICILLSILSWIFIGKETPTQMQSRKNQHLVQQKVKSPKKIPSLNSFWDNTLPKEKVTAPLNPPVQVQTPLPAPMPVQEAPIQRTPVMPIPQVRRHQDLIPTINRRDIVLPKKKDIAKPSQSINRVSSSIALNEYKGAIRQRLLSHLAVTSVTGEGRCSVEFSVDNSGRLVNRRFARLSDNKSLNDAVYNMMMSVPRVSPPPPEYGGQPIRLSFYFNNGYYEVSY